MVTLSVRTLPQAAVACPKAFWIWAASEREVTLLSETTLNCRAKAGPAAASTRTARVRSPTARWSRERRIIFYLLYFRVPTVRRRKITQKHGRTAGVVRAACQIWIISRISELQDAQR